MPGIIASTEQVTGQIGNLVEPLNGWNARSRTGRNENLLSHQTTHVISALNLYFMVGNQPCLAVDNLHVVGIIKQALVLVSTVFLDDLIFLGNKFCPIDRHAYRR